MANTSTSTEDRALALLGQGINPEIVASALGVDASRISQLLSDERFKEQVTALRYENLQRHNARDSTYDTLEDKLLAKLEKSLPLLMKPGDILKAIQVVNSAKRRGQSAPEQIVNQQTIVNITMPTKVTQQFTVDINNQVVKAGQQDLLTMDSKNLLNRIEGKTLEHSEVKTLPSRPEDNL